MHERKISPVRLRWSLILLTVLLLGTPALLYAHIRLEASTPARDEVLTSSPERLHLRFSARIEQRYTTVTLLAPDSSEVPTGPVVFISDSDREITVALPPLARSGSYTVRWRTAGADGHVLEGSYAFVLALDTTQAAPPPAPEQPEPHVHENDHAHHAPQDTQGVRDVVARGFHFLMLALVIGAVAFRAILIPRLEVTSDTRAMLVRRTWRVIAMSSVLLVMAALARLWLQSIALHGEEAALRTPLLSIMLTDTGWGRAWLLQALLFTVLGMAVAWARPGRDRAATVVALMAAAGLATIPGLTGHAAGTGASAWLALINDALHVGAVGVWLGMLAVLLLFGVPLLRAEPDPARAAASAVHRFSPIALSAAAVVVATGLINTLMHIDAPAQLWTLTYGRTLLLKLAFVLCVVVAGFVNWRVVRPRMLDADGIRRFRLSAAAELTFALLVMAATAVLTGQPRP